MPNKNDRITLTITDINNLGFGVGRAPDGKVVFVAHTADGDVCEVEIIKSARDYAVGRLLRLITPSPYREAPHCTVRGCGGCTYTEVGYAHERELKRRTVEAAFCKAGVKVTVAQVQGTGITCGYRNKAQYPCRPARTAAP